MPSSASQDTTGRPPAFQFYPKDFLTDSNVVVMSLQERGAYITLICQCWIEGEIPTDLARLARLCGVPLTVFRKLWPALAPCFRPLRRDADRLVHPRLERERQKQIDWRDGQSERGTKGAAARWRKHNDAKPTPSKINGDAISGPMAEAMLNDAFDLQSPSQSPSQSADSRQKPAAVDARSKRPIFKGQRFVVFEWQLDDLRRMLGAHVEPFDLHAWFFDLDAKAAAAELAVPQRDGGKWLHDETLAEAIRRGLPVAASASTHVGKTAGNAAAAARFIARGQR